MRSRTASERLLHTLSYEFLALLITIPGAAWIMSRPAEEIGITAVVLSVSAMVWNLIFNIMFDRIYPQVSQRNTRVRLLHAIGFEGGFVVIAVPLTALMLQLSIWSALLLDIGFLLFYLPYTYLFNWCWDKAIVLWRRLKQEIPCIW